jgi:hypothetical protein
LLETYRALCTKALKSLFPNRPKLESMSCGHLSINLLLLQMTVCQWFMGLAALLSGLNSLSLCHIPAFSETAAALAET